MSLPTFSASGANVLSMTTRTRATPSIALVASAWAWIFVSKRPVAAVTSVRSVAANARRLASCALAVNASTLSVTCFLDDVKPAFAVAIPVGSVTTTRVSAHLR